MEEIAPAPALSESREPEMEYRTVEPWAVAGLVLGLLSPLGTTSPLMGLLPPLAVLANGVALRRVKNAPHRIGRAAALVGLGLSLVFWVLPMAQAATTRYLLPWQAEPVAERFFAYLRADSPEKAINLKLAPDFQQPMNEDLWSFFRFDSSAKDELLTFVNQPLTRVLLALGPRAQVRLFKTTSVVSDAHRGLVYMLYTVTYPDEQDQKKTFLVGVVMERLSTRTPDINPWRVKDYSVIDPSTLGF